MTLRFSNNDRATLLAVSGVGPTVVKRLEAMGFHTLPALAQADAPTLLEMGASMTGSSCWKNSPQAKAAIQGAIHAAQSAGLSVV